MIGHRCYRMRRQCARAKRRDIACPLRSSPTAERPPMAALAASRRLALVRIPHSRPFFSFPDLTAFSNSQPESDTQSFHERKILPYVSAPATTFLFLFTLHDPHRYSQKQLYDVVSNIDLYHTFLPFCTASRVLRRAPRVSTTDPEQLEAELSVGFMGLSESYVSKVSCRPNESVRVSSCSSSRVQSGAHCVYVSVSV